jgi:hypothetical protein
MKTPRINKQGPDTSAIRIHRAFFIYLLLTAVLSTGAFAQSNIAVDKAAGRTLALPHNGILLKEPTQSALSAGSSSKTFTLTMPAGTEAGTIKVVLNGKDVSERFSSTSCDNAVCATGTLSSSDGLSSAKNVLYAVAKSEGGRVVSSRLRFAGEAAPAGVRAIGSFRTDATQQSSSALPTASGFLPTAVSLTASQGGYENGKPWIHVGSQQTYPDTTFTCSGIYTVIVLDRSTLTEKTAAPESSPRCFTDSATMASYFANLTPDDLVIAGTNYQSWAASGLNTTAIGGTDYTKFPAATYPRQYIIVGVGKASAGQAYEYYFHENSSLGGIFSFLDGILQEDLNGYYDFAPAESLEYIVNPNDAGYPGQSSIKVDIPLAAQQDGALYNLLLSPKSSGIGGYWLAVADRTTMNILPACNLDSSFSIPHTVVYNNCGTFFPTGDSNPDNAVKQYQKLSEALGAVQADQLAFLTTIGNAAASSDPFTVAATKGTDNSGNQNYYAYWGTDGYNGFYENLLLLNAPPYATMYLGTSGSAYTLIASPGLGNPLTGQSVISSTSYTQQGQTGYVHGLLSRDRNGHYRPGHTAQETQGADTADFTIGRVGSQPPVDWPELVTLLSGSDSVNGQIAAYHYLSYYLITQYYIPDATGNYVDDIHYYFTGSNNTYLDYHTFTPSAVGFPGLGQAPPNTPYPNPGVECSNVDQYGNCTWNDPISGRQYVFNQADYTPVKNQLSMEIIDLVNVLQFMVNGSVNMKDIIAAGNANTALALIGAASTLEASTLAPSSSTPVQVNSSNILSMAGSVFNIGATIASAGLIPPDLVASVDTGSSIIGDLFYVSSSISGGLTTGSPSSVPNPNYTLQTTIGQLANSDLQGQFSAAFDTTLDSILGDWGKLSQIGPLITDTSDPAFYSPNQTAQNVAVQLIDQSTQRSLMLSLLPTLFQVHYWPGVIGNQEGNGETYPDECSYHYDSWDGDSSCDPFYYYGAPYNPLAPVKYSYPAYRTPIPIGASPFNPSNTNGPCNYSGAYDGFVFTRPFQNAGQTNAYSGVPDQTVANLIFDNTPGNLNFPQELVVMPGGAMDQPPIGSSRFINVESHNPTGFSPGYICSAIQQNGSSVSSVGNPSPSSLIATMTTLTISTTAILGESVTLQATVAAASGPTPAGNVTFYDGNNQLGTGPVPLDANGNASLAVSGLSLGTHSIAAYYALNGNDDASQSNPSTLTVYANAPGMSLSLSANSLTVRYGATSFPVTLQVNSLSGLAGTVTYSCTGLPVGMTCNFNPAQGSLAAGNSVTTSLTIFGGTPQAAGVPWLRGIAILVFPLSLLCLWRIGGAGRKLQVFFYLLLSVVSVGYLTGCGGGGTNSPPLQETGSRTVLVNATSGSLTQSAPMILNIQ